MQYKVIFVTAIGLLLICMVNSCKKTDAVDSNKKVKISGCIPDSISGQYYCTGSGSQPFPDSTGGYTFGTFYDTVALSVNVAPDYSFTTNVYSTNFPIILDSTCSYYSDEYPGGLSAFGITFRNDSVFVQGKCGIPCSYSYSGKKI
jgi:hypothetical protein